MALRTVNAVRYITPLREGGSLPALVEADDGQQYVVKLRGAGQGTLALAAEVIAGEIARSLGLNMPELVFMQQDQDFGRQERDPEIRDLLRASVGTNLGMAFLTGATTFDPAAGDNVDASLASLIVWLDAYALNVDRTSRNANMLLWHDDLWLIDHGAALYFHHNWPSAPAKALAKFEPIADHILLPLASDITSASKHAHSKLTDSELKRISELVPDDWLSENDPALAMRHRNTYLRFLTERLANSSVFEQEVLHARSLRV
jgi:hypothetical protein